MLAPVTIADPEAIRVGHWAIAVGDPLGPQRVFAAGLISARPQRDCYQADLAATFLEASLQVHPEAYGGPLVDIEGAVMGIDRPAPDAAVRRGFERPGVRAADEHRDRNLRIAQGRAQLRVALAGRFGPEHGGVSGAHEGQGNRAGSQAAGHGGLHRQRVRSQPGDARGRARRRHPGQRERQAPVHRVRFPEVSLPGAGSATRSRSSSIATARC